MSPFFQAARTRWLRRLHVHMVLGIVLLLGACHWTADTATRANPSGEWHDFEGTWTAAGTRQILEMGNDRQASLGTFSGSLLLAGPSRPAVGFRGEAIVLYDSVTGMIGRAVWTDEHGDQAFSELHGGGTKTNNKIMGDFVGGTGRYRGATGTYEFSWRFLLENEDGTVQGQSVGLKGKVSVGHPPSEPSGAAYP